MVRLDNPYAFNRPRPIHFSTIIILFVIAYLFKKFTIFIFAYQFTIPIMLVLLIGYIFDRSILSKNMFASGEFPAPGRIYFFIVPILLSALFVSVTKFFNLTPHYYLLFSAQESMNRGELFVLLIVIAIPATEIVFRGHFQFLYSHLFGKKAALVASIITYVLFLFLFTNNVLVMSYATAMGILFSYISYRESSILPSIIAHEIIVLVLFIFRF